MITNTLSNTKKATFAVLVPHPDTRMKGFPTPMGTGFFVSKDGYFLTARHVLMHKLEDGSSSLYDPPKILFTKPETIPSSQVSDISIQKEWPNYDLILLKADFSKNKSKDAFQGKDGFDFIAVDFNVIPEGTQVYSFGYPLPKIDVRGSQQFMVGFHYFCPRVTSAIISSHHDVIGPVFGLGFPRYYVIDKALNYGNSGGPIIVQETGKAISVCVRFQPTRIPQNKNVQVVIPSLYGISSSLKNIESELRAFIKPCEHEFLTIVDRKKYTVMKCGKCGKTEKKWK